MTDFNRRQMGSGPWNRARNRGKMEDVTLIESPAGIRGSVGESGMWPEWVCVFVMFRKV